MGFDLTFELFDIRSIRASLVDERTQSAWQKFIHLTAATRQESFNADKSFSKIANIEKRQRLWRQK